MLQDVRLALRELRRRPMITLVAATSLALGIGANSAIFSYIDGLYLRPLALPDVGRLARVFVTTEQQSYGTLSYPEYEELRRSNAFSGVAAAQNRGARMLRGAEDQGVSIYATSPDFFQVLGVNAQLGRVFGVQDNTQRVVVLGHSAWRRYFGADPGVIGKSVRMSRGTPTNVTIIGVLPPSFRDLHTVGDRDIWMPPETFTAMTDGQVYDFVERRNTIYYVLARLKPGISAPEAQAELNVIQHRLAREYPEVSSRRRFVIMSDFSYRMLEAGTTGIVLLGVVLLVVAIACVNVANLLLARIEGRRQDLAVRSAIGATRWRLMRQLLVESAVLGALATSLGFAVAWWLIDIIPAAIGMGEDARRLDLFRLDGRVVAFTVCASILTVLLFGLAPAWIGASSSLTAALKNATLGTRRWPLRNVLALVQVSVSLVLLTLAALLVLSFRNTQSGEIGLARKNILNIWQSQVENGMEGRILERVRALPGVKDATLAFRAPLSGSGSGFSMHVSLPGHPEFSAGQSPVVIKYNTVEAGYFRLLGIRQIRGRTFTDADIKSSPKVAVISETMARRYWPNDNPLGKYIESLRDRQSWQIVGIVADAPIRTIGEIPEPYFYTPWWQNPTGEYTVMIETASDPASAAPLIRSALEQMDARLKRADITTMSRLIGYGTAKYSRAAQLVSALGVLGLVLTALGLYGVLAYGVTLRTREIGIRMALGARAAETARMVVISGLRLVLMGLVAGLPFAFLGAWNMRSMLFGIQAWHWPAFAITAVTLLAVAGITAWLPARRAARVNPIVALRYE